MILLNIAFAMSSCAGQTGQQSGEGMMPTLIMLGLIFLVFYFLVIRPQQRQQKKIQEIRENISVGERIMTTGGIYGIVESISQDTVMIKVADKVKIEVAKNAIAGIREGTKKIKKA